MNKNAKVLISLVLIAVLVVVGLDAASPTLTRAHLRTDAGAIGRAGEDAYFSTGSSVEAERAARSAADDRRVVLTSFEVVNGGAIRVTVGDNAQAYLLDRISRLHRYYVVEVSKTTTRRAGEPPSATTTTKAG